MKILNAWLFIGVIYMVISFASVAANWGQLQEPYRVDWSVMFSGFASMVVPFFIGWLAGKSAG